MANQPIYQFYAELRDYGPKIWRRFQVAGNITMARLGHILMTMYEMKANHLFCLTVPIGDNIKLDKHQAGAGSVFPDKCWRFEIKHDENISGDSAEKVFDAAEHKMCTVFQGCQGKKLILEYDYGVSWKVGVTLESILEDKDLPGRELPRVLAGEGYGIIEDCGGPEELEHLANVFHSKSGDDYETYREWLGQDELDLSTFDLDDMNLRLKKIPRIYTELYECGCAPSKRPIDFLERKYLK